MRCNNVLLLSTGDKRLRSASRHWIRSMVGKTPYGNHQNGMQHRRIGAPGQRPTRVVFVRQDLQLPAVCANALYQPQVHLLAASAPLPLLSTGPPAPAMPSITASHSLEARTKQDGIQDPVAVACVGLLPVLVQAPRQRGPCLWHADCPCLVVAPVPFMACTRHC